MRGINLWWGHSTKEIFPGGGMSKFLASGGLPPVVKTLLPGGDNKTWGRELCLGGGACVIFYLDSFF